MKKFYALLIIVVLMLSLSACGSKPQPTPTAAPTAILTEVPTEVPAEPTAAPTEAPAEPTAEQAAPSTEQTEPTVETSTEEASYDPNDMDSVYDYYSSKGDPIFDSYAFSQLDTTGKKTWAAPFVGIEEFRVPDAFLNAKGGVRASGGMEEDKGMVTMSVKYLAETEEDYNKFIDQIAEITTDINTNGRNEENVQKYLNAMEEYNSHATTLFVVLGMPNGAGEAEDKAAYQKYFDDHAEWYDYTEEEMKTFFDKMVFYPAGSADGYNFYLVQGNLPDDNNIERDEDVYKEEYKALYDNIADYTSLFKFMKPLGLAETIQAGTGFTFETKDVFGNPVKSADLFSGHKVTMLNIWETTCGACISEMPELIKLSAEFDAKGAQIVGLVYDATTEDLITEAKDIVEDLGIPYTNLVPTADMLETIKVQAFPTTYFLNEKGEFVGEPISGALFKLYRQQAEQLLGE